ncbi:uncharacterized protein [Palaemon carinicauda]|uniref:uncharacterized protein n=1 Tax=Palaemon carinicauda TaxID=392227 RepID=UPI0035B654E1
MNLKIPVLLCLVALVTAGKRRMYNYKSRQSLKKMLPDQTHPAKHDFEWQVKYSSGQSHFQRHETRNDDETRGSYSVMLPDGRRQTVTYYVDQVSGYVATVTYDGESTFPEYVKSAESEEMDSEEDDKDMEGRSKKDTISTTEIFAYGEKL